MAQDCVDVNNVNNKDNERDEVDKEQNEGEQKEQRVRRKAAFLVNSNGNLIIEKKNILWVEGGGCLNICY